MALQYGKLERHSIPAVNKEISSPCSHAKEFHCVFTRSVIRALIGHPARETAELLNTASETQFGTCLAFFSLDSDVSCEVDSDDWPSWVVPLTPNTPLRADVKSSVIICVKHKWESCEAEVEPRTSNQCLY